MTRSVLAFILVSVMLSALAQIALKGGMSSPGMALARSSGLSATALAIATSPGVLLGLAAYFASAVVWLFVLARIDVGLAYPFVGLGFIVTMLLAWAVHGEVPTPGRIAGALIICLGVVVLARS